MVTALDRMADKHRYMVAHFARRRPALDDVDLFLRDLNERIERVRVLLYNARQTGFAVVSIPEAMSVRETERYVGSLRNEGVPVTESHNQPGRGKNMMTVVFVAPVCDMQEPWLKELTRLFKDSPPTSCAFASKLKFAAWKSLRLNRPADLEAGLCEPRNAPGVAHKLVVP
jgi:anion-transporting  ArsA/GET3 family ATPase